MDNLKNLNSIANAIYAADKILNLLNRKQDMHEYYTGGNRTYDNMAVLGDIIKVIANYLPDNESSRGNNIKSAADKYSFYENTYKKLKQHLISVKDEGLTGDGIMETLVSIKPHIKGRRRTIIDKSIKIYKILKS